MNLLFVCSENRLRSPTGEEVFSQFTGVDAIGCGTNKDAETTISGDLIDWADIIFAMEKTHRNKISTKFREQLRDKKLVCLGIPDNYERMDPVLVRILTTRVLKHIPHVIRHSD